MSKTIAVLALPGVQLLDLSGPMDVFAQANLQLGKPFYVLRTIGCEAGVIHSSAGVRVLPDEVAQGDGLRVHTLLVAGAPHAPAMRLTPSLKAWLRSSCRQARRFGSVCTGAFVLAEAGLLDGRRVTTHWASAAQLAANYPAVQVQEDALYVRDRKLRTAAGVTAGLDLALALVEEDLGRELAMQVAAQLVMYFKRPGGQLQFSRKNEIQPTGRSALQEVQRWVAANPALDHSIDRMAEHTGLSARHFARLFLAEVGSTPAAWVETARVNAARAMLENGAEAPKQVAAICGFANADTLRRAFVKHVGVSAAAYRKQFVHE